MKMNEIVIFVYADRAEINMPGYLIVGNSLKDALNELKNMNYLAYEKVVSYIRNKEAKEVALAK